MCVPACPRPRLGELLAVPCRAGRITERPLMGHRPPAPFGRGPEPAAGDTVVLMGPSWCLLVGLCSLVPLASTQGGPEEDVAPIVRTEELGYPLTQDGDPQHCGITFHTPSPCSARGPPTSAPHDELDHLKNLLQDTKASLKSVEMSATLEDNQTSYQDVITEALPAIHGANLEFQETLDNIHRELEAHVAEANHPQMAEKKEKLQKGVRVVDHMLRLTAQLAQSLDDISQRLHAELQRLQSSLSHVTTSAEP
ncbi:uncharacterized protein LOC128899907 [Dryobates pubescens]|uniref:uncharacterized protein LOC128899907 n=1 Tax=Dryobates pubescens TaxID=118200 RepID=UPI0023B9A0A9|nr:uncharacterized protein LOC128899907 [Dryobates pubescens]